MWSKEAVSSLRQQLGMDVPTLAKLVGVEPRSVFRWEAGTARPTGSAEAVLNAVRARLDQDPDRKDEFIKFLFAALAIGGLAYLLLTLFESVPKGGAGKGGAKGTK